MKLRTLRFAAAAVALIGAGLVAPAAALADDVVAAARADGVVGEQAFGTQIGLLGIRDESRATPDLRRRVNEINGERRTVYFERAEQRGVSPAEMAAATACQLLSQRVAVGEYYRAESGDWLQRTASAPVQMPGYCG